MWLIAANICQIQNFNVESRETYRNVNLFRVRVNKHVSEQDPFINGVIFYNKTSKFHKITRAEKAFKQKLKNFL